jgi:cyclopropane-fatty-acyl-phospholipid synthase
MDFPSNGAGLGDSIKIMHDKSPVREDFESVQAHYDLGDEFFSLFLDPSMTYSCAKFDAPGATLAEAQAAKIDLALGKCELRPGQRLLDVGCGWGSTAVRACEKYGVRVVGLTLGRNQHEYCRRLAAGREASLDFRLQGWETFEEKVDRIVSIGAFEHFGRDKYGAFFAKCRAILPDDGVMLLHTITFGRPNRSVAFGRFVYFMTHTIFPNGEAPVAERVMECARTGGFEVVHVESLRPHYARTLDCWAGNMERNRARAVELAGEKLYGEWMKYLTTCAGYFRTGEFNVYQFKMACA